MSNDYPYADRYPVNRGMPEHGRSREEITAELATVAAAEDEFWETGRCSGTMYCGDHDHYDFMTEAFGLFGHVNVAAARHVPERHPVRGRDHRDDPRHARRGGGGRRGRPGRHGHLRRQRQHPPRGARLPRARPARRGIERPNIIKPETGHPAFDKACHLLGVELRRAPIDPVDHQGRRRRRRRADRRQDHRHRRFGLQLRLRHRSTRSTDMGDARPRAGDRPARRRLPRRVHPAVGPRSSGYAIPPFDFRSRASPPSRPTPTSTPTASRARRCWRFRDRALRNGQYFFLTDWTGGKYCSPGIDGSRSGGLLAATWAAMVSLGRDGYLGYAEKIFATADRDAGRGRGPTTRCASWATRPSASASPATSSTSTTSTTSCGSRAGGSTASSTRTRSTWP